MQAGNGYAAGSVEGRIAIEYFPDSIQDNENNFSYKCHRITKETTGEKISYIYPVNDISFHPHYHTFASCGSDGMIKTWDPKARRKLWKKQFDCGLTAISFSNGKSF